MTPATTGLYEAVVNGAVTHSGDPRLARHIGNAPSAPTTADQDLQGVEALDPPDRPRRLRDHGALGRRHGRPGVQLYWYENPS
jgi:hypothetical protein